MGTLAVGAAEWMIRSEDDEGIFRGGAGRCRCRCAWIRGFGRGGRLGWVRRESCEGRSNPLE